MSGFFNEQSEITPSLEKSMPIQRLAVNGQTLSNHWLRLGFSSEGVFMIIDKFPALLRGLKINIIMA